MELEFTPRPQADSEIEQLREQVHLLERIASIGTWSWDIRQNAITWSDQLFRIAGLPKRSVDFTTYTSLFHPDDLQPTLEAIQKAVANCSSYELEHRVISPDGTQRWWYCRGEVVADADGAPARVIGTVQDITDLRSAEMEARAKREAEAARARSDFLASASAELASSLDYEQTLENVARLAVPAFADYCVVDVIDDESALARLVTHHADPNKVALVTELNHRYRPDPNLPHGVHHVIRTGLTDYVADLPEELLVAAARDEEHLRILRSLGLRSFIVAPLIARDRTLGALTLVYADSGRRYEPADVAVVEDLARRAAVAIDNARLVHQLEEQRRTIEEQATELEMQSTELEAQTEELLAQQVELEQSVQRVSEQEFRWRQILDSVRDMIFTKKYGSVVSYANKASCEYYGMTEEQLRGLTDVSFNELDFTQQYIKDDLAVFQTGQTVEQLEEPNRSPTGEIRYFHTVKTPIFNSHGEVVELVGVSRDVTDQARARRALEEANRAKSTFLAVMSHELRTPLNAMIGYAELLLQGLPVEIPQPAQASVERIRLSARHLLEIIEDILAYSRIEAGRESVNLEDVAASQLIAEVSAIAQSLADRKQIAFEAVLPPSDVVLHTDARKLRQVLLNLVGNAFKFTERGEVIIELAENDDDVSLVVRDSGIGISEDDLPRIYEPFWQAATEKSRRVSGTGLGLTVTRQLVQLLGGSLHVESTVGVGTTFTVRLPKRH